MADKILWAGRSDEIFQFVRRCLDGRDCQVIKASSAALALFLSQKNKPSLVLSEFDMADGTGEELLDELKSEPELSAIPFVFLNLTDSRSTGMPGRQLAGAEKILWMPLTEAELLTEIAPYLEPSPS